jgi:hypothetical protein
VSDVAGAPAPAAAPAPAMETVGEAASIRLSTLRSDPAFGARRLAGDAAAVNEFKTLMEIQHGGHDDAAKAALAASIDLKPRPTLAAATRARAEAETAAAATRVNIPFSVASTLTPEELNGLRDDIGGWMTGLNLPPSTARTVLSRISEQGPKVSAMTPADRAAWLADQERMLVGAAGSKELAAEWRAGAEKLLKGAKYNLGNSVALSDAFVIRHLAMAAAAAKK